MTRIAFNSLIYLAHLSLNYPAHAHYAALLTDHLKASSKPGTADHQTLRRHRGCAPKSSKAIRILTRIRLEEKGASSNGMFRAFAFPVLRFKQNARLGT